MKGSIIVLGVGLALSSARPARADVSSWLFTGVGPTWLMDASPTMERPVTLEFATGMGTPPGDTIILGGLLDTATHFGHGTDLALSLRIASHGFVNGEWGAALDLGGQERWWGEGSEGGRGALVLGGPWGVTLDVSAYYGTRDHRTVSAVLGIDLARLTVYRRSGGSWWRNEFPAYRPEESARPSVSLR